MPSTTSIYAKPLKKCLVAPEGYVVLSVDFGQLEDRVIANLSKDKGKCSIFLKDLDSHCYNALGYFPKEIEEYMTITGDKAADTKEFKRLIDKGGKELKAIRQKGKGCTFGISYGSYPPKIADTIKCSLEEATDIFNGYHNDLYSGITRFREKVLAQARQNGYIHMGLGCRMYSDDIEGDSRTMFNSVSQFWSILTLLSIHWFHNEIDANGYTEDIKVTATIYDAIYMVIKADANIIHWANTTLIPIMNQDFIEDTIVHNEAAIELGTSWADVVEVANDATKEDIQEVLNALLSFKE